MGRKYYNDVFKEKVVDDYIQNNLTNAEICEKYGVMSNTLYKWCLQLGRCELKPFGNTHILKIKTSCNFSYKNICEMAVSNKWTFQDIINKLELNKHEASLIRQFIYNHKYKIDGSDRKTIHTQIIELLKEGLSPRIIAEKIGVSRTRVYTISCRESQKDPEFKKFIANRRKIVNIKEYRFAKELQEFCDGTKTYLDVCNKFVISYSKLIERIKKLREFGYEFNIKTI